MSKDTNGVLAEASARKDAADWFAMNDADQGPDGEILALWEEWSADPVHRAEYEEIVRIHQETLTLDSPPPASTEELLRDFTRESQPQSAACATPYASINRAPRSVLGSLSAFRISRSTKLSLAAVMVGTLLFMLYLFRPVQTEITYATAQGELHNYLLPDGSAVTLSGGTQLRARFSRRQRDILLDRGEAFFQVRADAQRPFIVHAGAGNTVAIGTSFEVRRYPDHVQVWVRDGAVAVQPRQASELEQADPGTRPVRVSQGQETRYDFNGKVDPPSPADPNLAAAWLDGHLVPLIYHGRPLAEVIADIQPLTARPIVMDSQVARLPYSGLVKQENIEAWIHDLVAIFPVNVIDCVGLGGNHGIPECADPRRIVIRYRSDGGAERPQATRL